MQERYTGHTLSLSPARKHTGHPRAEDAPGHRAQGDGVNNEQKTRDEQTRSTRDGVHREVVTQSQATKRQGQSACRERAVPL